MWRTLQVPSALSQTKCLHGGRGSLLCSVHVNSERAQNSSLLGERNSAPFSYVFIILISKLALSPDFTKLTQSKNGRFCTSELCCLVRDPATACQTQTKPLKHGLLDVAGAVNVKLKSL